MLANEAKAIFADVLENACVVCGADVHELCDTKTEWVHDERITYAEIPNDRYLRVAAIKKIKLPSAKPNLGDSYAAFVDSTYTFYDLFAAFNREATRFSGRNSEANVLTTRAFFRLLATTIKTLEIDFQDFANFYSQQKLTDREQSDFERLTKGIHDLDANFAGFTNAMRIATADDEAPGPMTVEDLRHSFTNLRREHLKFSLDYSIFMNNLLGQNLEDVINTLAKAHNDEEPANAQ